MTEKPGRAVLVMRDDDGRPTPTTLHLDLRGGKVMGLKANGNWAFRSIGQIKRPTPVNAHKARQHTPRRIMRARALLWAECEDCGFPVRWARRPSVCRCGAPAPSGMGALVVLLSRLLRREEWGTDA